MIRNAELVISGLQLDEMEQDIGSRSAIKAEYYERNGSHYLLYEEQPEGFESVSKCRMKIKENCLELVRQGDIRTQMIFEGGKVHQMDYQTPFGSLTMEIDTKTVDVRMEQKALHVTVEYSLVTWGDNISDRRIEIEVLFL